MTTATARAAHLRAVADMLESNPAIQPIDVSSNLGTRAFVFTADDALLMMRALGGGWTLGDRTGASYVYFVGRFDGQPFEISMPAEKAFGIAPSHPELLPELAEVVSET